MGIYLHLYFYFNFYCWQCYRYTPLLPFHSTPPSPLSPYFLATTNLLYLWVMHICSLANPFTFFHAVTLSPLLSDSVQTVPYIYASVSILFLNLFCSLDWTYKWSIRYLSFSDWLLKTVGIPPALYEAGWVSAQKISHRNHPGLYWGTTARGGPES